MIVNDVPDAFLADLNAQLAAIVSRNSGNSAPGTTFAGQIWTNTTNTPYVVNINDDANTPTWFPFMDTDGNMTPLDLTVGGDLIVTSGDVGLGVTPTEQFHWKGLSAGAQALFFKNITASTDPVVLINQEHATAAIPALVVKQDDISEGYINFVGIGRGAVPTSTVNSVESFRVEINGTVYVVAAHVDQ